MKLELFVLIELRRSTVQ